MPPTPPRDYDASSIQVLEGLEAVRIRPEMYVGPHPADALVLTILGGMCLSLEAVALGRASEIVLTVGDGLAFTVADDGPFPDLLRVENRTSLGETVLSVLMACRDLKPENLADFCEIPVVVPNALSRRTVLSVADEGAWWSLEFRDGRLSSSFTRGEPAPAGGVRLSFDLDPAFFPGTRLNAAVLDTVLARARALVPCARIVVRRG